MDILTEKVVVKTREKVDDPNKRVFHLEQSRGFLVVKKSEKGDLGVMLPWIPVARSSGNAVECLGKIHADLGKVLADLKK